MKNKRKKSSYEHFPLVQKKPEYYHHSTYPLEIRSSLIPHAGLGVFTMVKIPKDVVVDIYEGEVCRYNPVSGYYFEVREGYGIDAKEYPRCYMAMLNDSKGTKYENNCEFVVVGDRVEVRTIREIEEGDELLISYGEEYWR